MPRLYTPRNMRRCTALMCAAILSKLLRLILEPDGTVEPEDMLKNFLGRPLKPDVFYRDLGIRGRVSTN